MAVNLRRLRGLNYARVRRRIASERRARAIAAYAARALTPPLPHEFGAWGESSLIVPPARITMPEAIEVGSGVIIHEHAWISVVQAVDGYAPRLVIGNGTQIDRLCHIACVGEVEIGEHVLIGERVLIGDTFHRYDDVARPIMDQPMAEPMKVTIERGSAIGLGSMIMPGITIGEQAHVAAGAVVTRDVPSRTLAIGNPARVVKRYDDEHGTWVDCRDG